MKKKILRSVCCLLAVATVTAISACDLSELLGDLTSGLFVSDSEGSSSTSQAGSSMGTNSSETGSSTGLSDSYSPENCESESDSSGSDSSGTSASEGNSETPETSGGQDSAEGGIDFTPAAETKKYGYQQLSAETNGNGCRAFYEKLFAEANVFLTTDKNVSAEVSEGKNYYCIAKVPYAENGLTNGEAVAVWKTFRADYPEFWWLSTQVLYTDKELYLLINEEYCEGDVRTQTQSAIQALAQDCARYAEGAESDLEKAVEIYDYLAAKFEYAYETDGITPESEVWAHDLTGFATNGKGVCETYAETYDYLCGLFDVECITITGQAGQEGSFGGHAWNAVKLGGEWYAVDVTWGDYGADNEYGLNLVNRSWFGKSATEFATTHIATTPEIGMGINYQVASPTLSENALCPVLFAKDGGESEWAASIDSAFGKMTDEGGRYEITLYPESRASAGCGAVVHPYEASFSSSLPAVESLQFTGGKRVVSENGGFWLANLTSVNAFTLNGNVTLKDIYLTAPSVNENGHKLTKLGEVRLGE